MRKAPKVEQAYNLARGRIEIREVVLASELVLTSDYVDKNDMIAASWLSVSVVICAYNQ